MCDVDRRRKTNVFKVNKGVNSFEYSSQWNVIVTGGLDRLLRMWNPYVTTTPTAVRDGIHFNWGRGSKVVTTALFLKVQSHFLIMYYKRIQICFCHTVLNISLVSSRTRISYSASGYQQ